jgi:HK97 gp10 family phage protein
MSDGFEIERLVNNLEVFTDEIYDAAEKSATRALMKIQGTAKKLVPVDSGRLRESITIAVERGADGGIVGTVGTNVDYAAYVELGTGPRGAASEKDLPPGMNPVYRNTPWAYDDPKTGERIWTAGTPAKPFLYPAYKSTQHEIESYIADSIAQVIKGD